MLYSFTFEQKHDWTRPFARQAEIQQYMFDCVKKYELEPHIRYEHDLSEATWDDDACTWHLRTTDGWTTSADVLISALGMFNVTRWPDIPGLAHFEGHAVHTAAWPSAGLDLRGKTVAVIGTAASATQLIPEIARDVDTLFVCQRTANWVFPKDDDVLSDIQLEERRRDPQIGLGIRKELLDYFEQLLTWDKPEMMKELADKGLANLTAVEDLETRKKLYPQLPFGSQRPLFSNDFYPAFNRPNVHLITDGITAITRTGVQTEDGIERTIDVLILATGYHADRYLSVVDVTGRAGLKLREVWRDGAQAYLGITVSGFPNLFMLYGPNTNTGSILYMLELQTDYIVGKLQHMEREDIAYLDVRRDVMDRYNEAVQRDIAAVEPWRTIGTKYYRAASGRLVTQWPLNMAAYEARTLEADESSFEIVTFDSPTRAGASGRPTRQR
jgi:cation diffusion facilitator CzcD-associated flavoprotein CzcO